MRLGALAAGLLAAAPAAGQVAPADLQDRAVEWLQEYIRIDTVNPPGNEIAGARFFAAILEAEGIPYELVESAPGRGNIWARLDGATRRISCCCTTSTWCRRIPTTGPWIPCRPRSATA